MKLVKEYKEGLKVYKCNGCGRDNVNIAKGHEAKCPYCGHREEK